MASKGLRTLIFAKR